MRLLAALGRVGAVGPWIVLAGLALGCATDHGPDGGAATSVWVRPEAPGWTAAAFKGDRGMCTREAGAEQVERAEDIFESCMRGRGYQLAPEASVDSCLVESTGVYWRRPEGFCQPRGAAAAEDVRPGEAGAAD